MSPDATVRFELPENLEKLLAVAATYFDKKGKTILNKLLVNSTYTVDEGWTYDNWDGGTYSHAITFVVPSDIFYEIIDHQGEISQEITRVINKVANYSNEFIADVSFDIVDDPTIEQWRDNSGVLIQSSTVALTVSDDQMSRIWTPEFLRLFASHKVEYKQEISQLKSGLQYFGVSCFVAHEDIEPTREWQDEIRRALFSMDAQLVLMTEGFSHSKWTDQEVGVAIGRRVPIVPVKLGTDPYGFLGGIQALAGSGKNSRELAKDIYNLLWKKAELKQRLSEALICRFESADSFNHANVLMKYLTRIKSATPELIKRLELARQNNDQVRGAYTVTLHLPTLIERLRSGSRQ